MKMATVTTAADIGSTIAAARKSRKLTQAKLAELAGTSQAVVSEIERGKETARLSIVLNLVAAVGLQIDIREPGSAHQTTPSSSKPAHVVFDEPLPDDSIDLDAIVGSTKHMAAR